MPNNVADDYDFEAEDGGAEMNALKAWRHGIADAIWAQYQIQLGNLLISFVNNCQFFFLRPIHIIKKEPHTQLS